MKKILLALIISISTLFSSDYYYSTGEISYVVNTKTFSSESFSYISVYNGCSNPTPSIETGAVANFLDSVQVAPLPSGWYGPYTGANYIFANVATASVKTFSTSADCLLELPTTFNLAVSFTTTNNPSFDFFGIYASFGGTIQCPPDQTHDPVTNTCVTFTEPLVCPPVSEYSYSLSVPLVPYTGKWIDGVCESLNYICPDSSTPYLSDDGYTCSALDCSSVPGSYGSYDGYVFRHPTDPTAAFAVTEEQCSGYVGYALSDELTIQNVHYTRSEPYKTQCPGTEVCYFYTSITPPPVDCSLDVAISLVEDATGLKHISTGDASIESCIESVLFGSFINPRYINTADSDCPDNPSLCFANIEKTCFEKYTSSFNTPTFSNYTYESQLSSDDCKTTYPYGYHYMPSGCSLSFPGLCYNIKPVYNDDGTVNNVATEEKHNDISFDQKPKTFTNPTGGTISFGSDLSLPTDTVIDKPSPITAAPGTVYADTTSATLGSATDISEMNNRDQSILDSINNFDYEAEIKRDSDRGLDGFNSINGSVNGLVDSLGLDLTDNYGTLTFDDITFTLFENTSQEKTLTLFSSEVITSNLDPYIDFIRSIIIALAAMSAFLITFRSN